MRGRPGTACRVNAQLRTDEGGHQRSSEVIRGHQRSSEVISRMHLLEHECERFDLGVLGESARDEDVGGEPVVGFALK